MAQRLRLGSPRGMAVLRRLAGRNQCWRWLAACRSGLLQPEEERSRPRRAGDLSRDRGQRAVLHALPGEPVVEDHDLVSSPLPLAHQPGSGLQLRAEVFRSLSSLLQLLCNLAQLALRLRAQTAQSNLLDPVCDRSDQQLAAEMWGSIGFVETV